MNTTGYQLQSGEVQCEQCAEDIETEDIMFRFYDETFCDVCGREINVTYMVDK